MIQGHWPQVQVTEDVLERIQTKQTKAFPYTMLQRKLLIDAPLLASWVKKDARVIGRKYRYKLLSLLHYYLKYGH